MGANIQACAYPKKRPARIFTDLRDGNEAAQYMRSFLTNVWDFQDEGYVFLAAKDPQLGAWNEAAMRLGDCLRKIRRFIDRYPWTEYDLYFCPNAFSKPKRLASHALPTSLGWCDIDKA